MFLTTDDYATVIEPEDLDIYTNSSEVTRQRSEASAIEDISSYLRPRYDVAAAFAAVGDARNPKLVELVIDLSIWNVLAAHSYRAVSEIRGKRRDDAVAYLKLVQAGRLTLSLPRPTDTDGAPTRGVFLSGSQPPRSHLY